MTTVLEDQQPGKPTISVTKAAVKIIAADERY
jgi:hypothetical protein